MITMRESQWKIMPKFAEKNEICMGFERLTLTVVFVGLCVWGRTFSWLNSRKVIGNLVRPTTPRWFGVGGLVQIAAGTGRDVRRRRFFVGKENRSPR
jgi:NADH:ubiquinone oxidoreductase subunit H